jgi:hypothetical protein
MQINIGRVIYGLCNGFFGRNSYDNKRIEAEGIDWIMAREMEPDAKPEFAIFENMQSKQRYIDEWADPKNECG